MFIMMKHQWLALNFWYWLVERANVTGVVNCIKSKKCVSYKVRDFVECNVSWISYCFSYREKGYIHPYHSSMIHMTVCTEYNQRACYVFVWSHLLVSYVRGHPQCLLSWNSVAKAHAACWDSWMNLKLQCSCQNGYMSHINMLSKKCI